MCCATLTPVSDDAEAPKPVVRRVVRRTVVRPADQAREAGSSTPRRPTPAARTTAPKPAQKTRPTPVTKRAQPPVTKRAQPPVTQPPRRSPRESFAAVTHGLRRGRWWVADRLRDVSAGVTDAALDSRDRVLGYRLPVWPPARSALVVGALAGLLATVLGAVILATLRSIRGVSAAGGWGVLVFLALALLIIVVSRALLRGFGHPQGTVVAYLSTALSIVVILIFFLDIGESPLAVLILPAIGALTHGAVSAIIEAAEAAPQED